MNIQRVFSSMCAPHDLTLNVNESLKRIETEFPISASFLMTPVPIPGQMLLFTIVVSLEVLDEGVQATNDKWDAFVKGLE